MSSANVETVVVHIDDVSDERLQPPTNIPTIVNDENTYFNDECVICFDNIKAIQEKGEQVVSFECKHQICRVCVMEYIKAQLKQGLDITCPMCRCMLLNSNSVRYQQHRRILYNNNLSQESNHDLNTTSIEQRRRRMNEHIGIQMQFYNERHRLEAQLVNQRCWTFKRVVLYMPCIAIAVLVFTLIGLYHRQLK
jgi:hypothetical protein